MSRQNTAIILTLITVGIAVLATWNWHRRSPPSKHETVEAAPEESVSSPTNLPRSSSSKTEAEIKREERNRSVSVAIERTNVPITFVGKVIDQDGNALPEVSVTYTYSVEQGNAVGVPWSNTKVAKGRVTSDSSGAFAITGIKGSTLHIESLQRSGFRHHARGAMVFNYFGHAASGKFVADTDKPVVFVMINQSMDQPLVSYGGPFGKTIRLLGDGTPVRWSLWKGQPDPNGDLMVTLKRDPSVLTRVGQTVNWSAKLGVVGGGIVEASPDEPLYQAPAEGYVSELDYPKIEQKHGVPARSFYIKTADGKYGRIELDLYADDEGPTARCLIKVVMNPSGSQNLEAGSGER